MAHTASELIRAMEEGRAVRKNLGDARYVELRFYRWQEGARRRRLVRMHANHVIRPASCNNYRSWLAELVERPEEWEVVDG